MKIAKLFLERVITLRPSDGKELSTIESNHCIYKASHLSNFVWEVTSNWGNFAKYTIGQQFVDAVDSISANIKEGFGRYH